MPQKQVLELIKRSNKILIMPSSPPDGDSIGSAMALHMTFKKIGKESTIISKDEVPELLQFLPNTKIINNKLSSTSDFIITIESKDIAPEDIKTEKDGDKVNIIINAKDVKLSEEQISFNKGKIDYDLIITVDCAELTQLGDIYESNIEMFHQIPVINIDHHISNTHFGKINFVDIMASSTTELLLALIEELAREEGLDIIDEDIATLLLTGIITDTGSFQNANTTPKSFASSAKLISYGARQQEIIQHIYKTKQLSQLKLWGRVLSKIQTDEKYKIVWSVVKQEDFKDTGSTEEETGDIIDELMTNAPGAEIIFLIKEKEDGTISVSLRTTNPSINASKIAESFGGGGHTRAAGFRITDQNVRDAEYKIINYLKEFQTERLGLSGEKEQENIPIINVQELIARANEAQKATDIMQKVEESTPQVQEQESKRKRKRKRKRKSNETIAAEVATSPVVETPPAQPIVEPQAPQVVEAPTQPIVEPQAPPVVEAPAQPVVEPQAPPVVEAPTQPIVEPQVPQVVETPPAPPVEPIEPETEITYKFED